MTGYHFTADTLRDGMSIPPVGEWLEHDGPIEPCVRGLHASEHPFDALMYAPGNSLHKVELDGDIKAHGEPIDKWVGRRRKIVASINAETVLRDFARWCALQVIDLWNAPPIVREYLETGDDTIRAAARAAAWAAAGDTAWAAAGETAWDAAWAAVGDTAWAAARAAARAVARDAARAAARDAQRDKFLAMIEEAFLKAYYTNPKLGK